MSIDRIASISSTHRLYGFRTGFVRVMSGFVRVLYGLCTGSVRVLYGCCTGVVGWCLIFAALWYLQHTELPLADILSMYIYIYIDVSFCTNSTNKAKGLHCRYMCIYTYITIRHNLLHCHPKITWPHVWPLEHIILQWLLWNHDVAMVAVIMCQHCLVVGSQRQLGSSRLGIPAS